MGVPNVAVRGAVEDEPYMVFPLEKSDLLADFDSKLIIDWGKGLSRVDTARGQEK
jgi:hypothetical protein